MDVIVGDRADLATLEVRLVDLDGILLEEDNATRVAFQIVEGQG